MLSGVCISAQQFPANYDECDVSVSVDSNGHNGGCRVRVSSWLTHGGGGSADGKIG